MPREGVVVFSEPSCCNLEYITRCVTKKVAEEAPSYIEVHETGGLPEENDEALEKFDPVIFYSVGHGQCCVHKVENNLTYIEVAGYDCKVHFACNFYTEKCREDLRLDAFVGRVVHLLSCVTGMYLGPALVEHGARAFVGYDHLFVFGWWVGSPSPPPPCTPAEPTHDMRSAAECDAEGVRTLLNGGSVADAIDAMKAKFEEYIEKYTTGEWKDWPIAEYGRMFLQHDLDHLVVYGDTSYVPCPGLPDLAITPEDVMISPEVFREGDEVAIAAVVRNVGLVDAESAVVRFYVNNERIGETMLDRVEAGGLAYAATKWMAVRGAHTLTVSVEEVAPEDARPENNVVEISIEVPPAPEGTALAPLLIECLFPRIAYGTLTPRMKLAAVCPRLRCLAETFFA